MQRPFFDAMISDPPYGIKVGARNAKTIDQNNKNSWTNKADFSKDKVYEKLTELASLQLCSGRRLVFFYHTDKRGQEAEEEDE